MRDYKVYLRDIANAAQKIEKHTHGLDFAQFHRSDLLVDAVIRNLEIMGETAKNIPVAVRRRHNDIEWKKLAGLRDILIHEYFGVDDEIVWDIVVNKVPGLHRRVLEILEK